MREIELQELMLKRLKLTEPLFEVLQRHHELMDKVYNAQNEDARKAAMIELTESSRKLNILTKNMKPAIKALNMIEKRRGN